MARFFPSGGDAVTADSVAAAARRYQEGQVTPESTPDLAGDGLNRDVQLFRTSAIAGALSVMASVTHQYSTATVFGYRETIQLYRFGARPVYNWKWSETRTANTIVFVGFSSQVLASLNAVDNPGAALLGLQKRVGDSNWFLVHKDQSGGTLTRVDTGHSAADGVFTDLDIDYKSETDATVVIRDDTDAIVFSSTITTNLPIAASQPCAPTYAIDVQTGTATATHFGEKGQVRGVFA